MPTFTPDLRIVSDLEELERAAAGEVARLARQAGPKQSFAVALSGGTTPKGMYARLAQDPYRGLVPWPALQVFWGDERHVPPDHPDSNYRMASETLLSKVPVPAANVHRIRAENPDAVAAAKEYAASLRAFFRLRDGETPRFHLVLLGVGADGHVASLFPGSEALRERADLVAAPWVESLGVRRITLTPPALTNAACILLLACGGAKQAAIRQVLSGDGTVETCPALLLREARGRVVIIADRAAAPESTR